ncbi:MAG: N-6 DNA methylase [Verrucomicrobia bacterium]|nr:N-6 DNA methylase [Verrucomicrobiota bacterium]
MDRRIVSLTDPKYFPKRQWTKLQQVLEGDDSEVFGRLYNTLFPQLKRDFNGNMFDDAGFDNERDAVLPEHLQAVRHFFGAHEVKTKQQVLGFWPYDFSFIPVETISAIYENFLAKEGDTKKREDGAYYTPRLLAEMTLDLAMEGTSDLTGKRFLDPACGSGIFLVLLFNRMAAEWTAKHPAKAASNSKAAYQTKDKALRRALSSLRGVDVNPTACRIACFSLYLAFLDQFDPKDVRSYIQQSATDKLPNLLRFKNGKGRKPDIPVIWEGDFFPLAKEWQSDPMERFDCIVGNPPWVRVGSSYIEQEYMKQTPDLLSTDGNASLILPTKVFLNKTDEFQDNWLRQVTLEKVVQLADYSFILFTNAICPCLIARYTSKPPSLETHRVEYLTPKVDRMDLRQGAIPIAPSDRKEIPLRLLLGACAQKAATMAWKSHFWGTPRDLKFLNHLFALPRLGELAGRPSEVAIGQKRWSKGQGFQPLSPGQKSGGDPKPITTQDTESWSPNDLYVDADCVKALAAYPEEFCCTLLDFLNSKGFIRDKLRRKPKNRIFQSPLVLLNQGFTGATFFNYQVRFQDSLQSIAGPHEDEDKLIFLAAYLRSRLARYFVFHTSANIGMERDKVHLDEVLNLPFFLPGQDGGVSPDAENLIKLVAARFRTLQKKMSDEARKLKESADPENFRLKHTNEGTLEEERKKWLAGWAVKTAKVQAEVEPLIYKYFGLVEQEIALVEDTINISDKSDTPGTLDTPMPTLEPIDAMGLHDYARMLGDTLRSWSLNKALSTNLIAGANEETGLAVLRVEQTRNAAAFHTAPLTDDLANAVKRIEEAATTDNGTLVYLRDETWWFEGPAITIAKPALRGRWTRTAAINDAAEIYTTIQLSRQGNA